ncbi:AMP deaminase 2 [Aphelenchoides besseyi]|nr:AMP deaminase 2 [Aphelenchoides besseyi]
MASRKSKQFFVGGPKSPPSSRGVNFYNSSVDEDNSIAVDEDEAAMEKEMLEKMRRNTVKDDVEESVDSEVFDTSPFQSAVGGSGSQHVVSSPFETPHYPIEIQENKKSNSTANQQSTRTN